MSTGLRRSLLCRLVLGFVAVRAEQVPQLHHFAAEALNLVRQGRQVWVGGVPFLLAGGFSREQLSFAVGQRSPLAEVLEVDGQGACSAAPA